MIPNKILWYLGYNNLALMLEQERKHWLLKTDKRKQIQDKATGDIFEGEIDNRGSDIKVRSSKLSIKSTIIPTLSFVDDSANKILDFANAAFPFSMGMKGFMFARITSINYPFGSLNDIHYKNYRVVFENAVKRTLAFGVSPYSSEVYAGEWIETSTPPTLQMMDDFGDYTNNVNLPISGTTNAKFYYPLSPGLQPFNVDNPSVGKYVSDVINDDAYIGYPLFWFVSDETQTGPTVKLGSNGYNSNNMAYMIFSTEGNSGSMYNGKAYVNVDGTSTIGATPDLSLPSGWEIRCEGTTSFNDSDMDYNIPIDISKIYFYKKSTGNTTTIPIISGNNENNIFNMIKDIGWEYVSSTVYKIDMDVFTSNNESQSGIMNPLTALFNVYLDESVPFYIDDKSNLGYAGIEFTASNPVMDTESRYPHDLDKWEGLPSWYSEPSVGVPQHMAIYTIHNTPNYNESNPESRQVAALLLDPGVMKVDDSEELENDEIGRIYVISNDDPVYDNNATSKNPKPARTIARMCDIPTSVSDFLNIEGLVPVSIVDPKYVRSQASYSESEKNRLWNTLNSKIVTPLSKDQYGNSFYSEREQYPYIWTGTKNLRNVDLIYNNDFREWVNLNSMVDPTNVSLYSIANAGEDYTVNATGIIVIGGVAMNYIVTDVDEHGHVLDASIVPEDNETFINLSNFDMVNDDSGITNPYGTTPAAGVVNGESVPKVGEGLEVVLIISNYASIKPHKENIYDDLVAFVYEGNELKLYRYITNDSNPFHVGSWGSPMTITYYDKTDSSLHGGGYSSADALTNLLIPHIQNINVCSQVSGNSLMSIKAMVTPSFMNIIDTTHTPIKLTGENGTTTYSHVDLCGFHCDAISNWISVARDDESLVMDTIRDRVVLDRDAYLIWQWENNNHKRFRYGIIRRSMNNYVTTDTTTTIPSTPGIKYNSWIHTNNGTTVVWDVPEVGPMMWVYNPNYIRKEIYTIDQNTRELFMTYSNEEDTIHPNEMNWDDIDFRLYPSSGVVEKIINDGIFQWYVYTNTPAQGTILPSIYDEYEYTKLASQGDTLTESTPRPVGNWQLVFPRVNEYKIVSTGIQEGVYNTEVKLRRLVPLFSEDAGDISNVVDVYGNNINQKVVVFDQSESGTKMKVWNKETGQFEIV